MRVLVALLLALCCWSANAATVTLTWTDNSTNESGFSVWRASGTCVTAGLSFAQIGSVAANTVTYADTTVAVGNHYCYEVQAFNADAASPFSNLADAYVPLPAPSAPSGLKAVVGP